MITGQIFRSRADLDSAYMLACYRCNALIIATPATHQRDKWCSSCGGRMQHHNPCGSSTSAAPSSETGGSSVAKPAPV